MTARDDDEPEIPVPNIKILALSTNNIQMILDQTGRH